MVFATLFRRPAKREALAAQAPEGERIYAIGDIHGRLDLLDSLIDTIDADDRAREPASTRLIFLGDLIDRGPHSAQVVERLMALKRERPETAFLTGNHEEVLLLALAGDRAALKLFLRIGGRETTLSYGVSESAYLSADYDELHQLLVQHVPADHIAFLQSFEDMIVAGSYVFVHAGIRPGQTLEEQKVSDLRWIRNEFLDAAATGEHVVVHGHSISESVALHPHRIGLDTGAYASGILSALGIEGRDRWILQT